MHATITTTAADRRWVYRDVIHCAGTRYDAFMHPVKREWTVWDETFWTVPASMFFVVCPAFRGLFLPSSCRIPKCNLVVQ